MIELLLRLLFPRGPVCRAEPCEHAIICGNTGRLADCLLAGKVEQERSKE